MPEAELDEVHEMLVIAGFLDTEDVLTRTGKIAALILGTSIGTEMLTELLRASKIRDAAVAKDALRDH